MRCSVNHVSFLCDKFSIWLVKYLWVVSQFCSLQLWPGACGWLCACCPPAVQEAGSGNFIFASQKKEICGIFMMIECWIAVQDSPVQEPPRPLRLCFLSIFVHAVVAAAWIWCQPDLVPFQISVDPTLLVACCVRGQPLLFAWHPVSPVAWSGQVWSHVGFRWIHVSVNMRPSLSLMHGAAQFRTYEYCRSLKMSNVVIWQIWLGSNKTKHRLTERAEKLFAIRQDWRAYPFAVWSTTMRGFGYLWHQWSCAALGPFRRSPATAIPKRPIPSEKTTASLTNSHTHIAMEGET